MRTPDFVPPRDSMFHLWQINFCEYVPDKLAGWGISPMLFTALLLLKNIWDAAWAAYNSATAHNDGSVEAKNTARKNYESALRQFIRANIASNKAITNEERALMHITVPKDTRMPSPPPITMPVGVVKPSILREVHIHYYDLMGDIKHKAKPYGVHGAEIRWAILDAPTQDTDLLINSAFDTRTPFVLRFSGNDRGKKVYFALRWENTRGVKGPFSPVYEAVIP